MSEIITKHLIISGKVQGVAFRAWMAGKAKEHGVLGWVRNKGDGTVEATLHGQKEKVEKLVREAYEGPQMAAVANIIASETDEYDGPAHFEEWPTA